MNKSLSFIHCIVDLNYLPTSDKFIQSIVDFYRLDNAIQAPYNAIFTLGPVVQEPVNLTLG